MLSSNAAVETELVLNCAAGTAVDAEVIMHSAAVSELLVQDDVDIGKCVGQAFQVLLLMWNCHRVPLLDHRFCLLEVQSFAVS